MKNIRLPKLPIEIPDFARADITARAMVGIGPLPLCNDCGEVAHPYMVTKEVWLSSGMTGSFLCLPCLEKRLKRDIVPADLAGPKYDFCNCWMRWHGDKLVLLNAVEAFRFVRTAFSKKLKANRAEDRASMRAENDRLLKVRDRKYVQL